MPKSEKSSFDPKSFLAKIGEGKVILKFKKTQIIFAQGDVLIQFSIFKREGSRFSLSQGSSCRDSGTWTVLWRRMPQRPSLADFDNHGHGGMPGYLHRKKRDADRASEGAKVLTVVHGVS
jgi:hypothetical protein